MTRAIAARDGFAGTVTGVDQSPDFIAAAQRLAARTASAPASSSSSATCTRSTSAPTFDAVVAHTLVSHVRDPRTVLAEAARVVRPGGWVAVFDGDYASLTFGAPTRRSARRWRTRSSR